MNNQFAKALENLEQQAPEEFQVLQLVLSGHTDDEIARSRGRNKGTIRKQISKIYKKFGITGKHEGDRSSRRAELIALFERHNLNSLSYSEPTASNVKNTSTFESSNRKCRGELGSAYIGSVFPTTVTSDEVILVKWTPKTGQGVKL